MRALLSSPRRVRRISWTVGLSLLVGSLVFVGIHWPNTAKREPNHFTNEPAQVPAPIPKAVKLPKSDVLAARAMAKKFVEAAVLGGNVRSSYDMTTAEMHQGIARKHWNASEGTPIVPYTTPVLDVRVDPVYMYANTIGLHIGIVPTPKSQVRGQVFDMELTAVGAGKARHWLVNAWSPVGGIPPPSNTPVSANEPVHELEPGIGGGWIFAPLLALLGAILLVPAILLGRGWWRNARANRAWSQSS